MAKDHYVSQTHLNQFADAAGLLHATRKRDQKSFTNLSGAFCEEEAGSTNRYLEEPRAIEEFLKLIEPKYVNAVNKLRDGSFGSDEIFVIAGFIAYVMWFSPAGMRINQNPLEHVINEVGRRLDAAGEIPRAPDGIGGSTFSEMLDQGKIKLKVDPKYPQAIGVTILSNQIFSFGNFYWEILQNHFSDSPFFTSDYPIAIEPNEYPQILNRVVPLARDLAVRICPNPLMRGKELTDFSGFRFRCPRLDRKDVAEINRIIVRCAESIVFYPKDAPWIRKFVKENANYRIEPRTTTIRTEDGVTLQISTSVVTDEGPAVK